MRYVWYLIGLALWIVIAVAAANYALYRLEVSNPWVICFVAILAGVAFRPAVRFLYQCSKGLDQ